MPFTTPRNRASAGRSVWLMALLTLVAAVVVGCSGSSESSDPSTTTAAAGGADPASDADVDGSDPVEVGRIVALGEERVLADLLALGITPVASTANVIVDGGFVGLDQFDTAGIEPLPSTDRNVERLASLRPDVIVTNEFVLGELGSDVLEKIAEVVVVPNGDAATQVRALGEAFDRRDEAEALVAELETAIEEGREHFADIPEDERVVSVLTIYSGPTLAAWIDGPVDTPATLLALGYTLRPDSAAVAGAPGGPTDGRAYLSDESIGLFDAPTIVRMQTDHVEGEDDAIAAIEASPLWQMLPAVQSDRVITVDRLGYPGISGHIRLVADLVEKLGA